MQNRVMRQKQVFSDMQLFKRYFNLANISLTVKTIFDYRNVSVYDLCIPDVPNCKAQNPIDTSVAYYFTSYVLIKAINFRYTIK